MIPSAAASSDSAPHSVALFAVLFAFAFLFFFGLGTLGLMIMPVLASSLGPEIDYHPQLPVSAERDEGFYDITTQQTRALFPSLTAPAELQEGNWIRIPSIGVAVPLALSPSMRDEDVLNTLDHGAALYPNGISPGRLGNVFVSAHSTGEPWKGKYRFAFLKINQLTDDNVIHLDYDGTRYTYRITDQDIIVPTPDFRVVSDRPVPTVTLMACWPLWSTDKRMLIRGELTNVTQLRSPPVSSAGQAKLTPTPV